MNLSLNWLKDFVDIPKKITPEELGLKLTMHTVEIDSVQKQADKYKNIVVGKILEISKHPDADKLQLVKVDIKKKVLDIVCGATNIAVGQLVPVALVGAILPNGLEIKAAEIRGQKSAGMLCAEDELGLGEDHAGILILDERAKVGQSLADYLNIADVVFDVDNKSITHRPDLWGHYGLAREIATFLKIKTTKKFEQISQAKIKIDQEENKLEVKVEDFKLCPRYLGIIMSGIKIASSPKWLQDRLVSVGVRPINNIVDATNYVMLELGQPLHAFDQTLVDKIIVRPAKEDETIETLDGEKRKLDKNMLVIADSKKPIAIAGIMGGANSEINDQTNMIILESANFDFVSIRKTSQKLSLRTEASMRFEKSLDPNLSAMALVRVVNLIKEICPSAKVSSQVADEQKFSLNQGPIELDLAWLKNFLGNTIKKERVVEILTSLGFVCVDQGNKISVTIPTWRANKDVASQEDLAEEVVRIYGYDNLKLAMSQVVMKAPEIMAEKELINKIKKILVGGPSMREVYNYSFVGEDLLHKLRIDSSQYIHLANPIAVQHTLLRQSLAPNLFLNVKFNQPRYDLIKIFEIGSIYLSIAGEINKDAGGKEKLPYQEKRLGILVASSVKDNVLSKAKGIIEYLLAHFNLAVEYNVAGSEIAPSWSAKDKAAKIKVGQRLVGFVSVLDKKAASNLGIKKECALAEISLKELLEILTGQETKKYKELDKFPPAIRDLAFVVNEKVLYNDIRQEIINYHPYIKEVGLFDVYQGGKVGADNKNLAFHIIYQADRTLTAKEIDELQQGLIKSMEAKFEAKIRDF
ncbi:MAG: phenylalanine--tRNA ligase subunit beta [Candidatus Falkowbacteria bacterium]|nr:phenylalanine--tRNA ligase subunit beta [Candidatus Falkowbacteria bacterium]